MQNPKPVHKIHPAQQQKKPGLENTMSPYPAFDTDAKGGSALARKVGLITGGDSGIGRAIAVRRGSDRTPYAVASDDGDIVGCK